MQTTLNQTNTVRVHYTREASLTSSVENISVWTRFMNFCRNQEHNRLLWVGVALAVHGCVLTPITVMATLFAGPNFFLFMTAMIAMGIALVTNLAAMPTRITIPAFALSILMDIAILVSCVAMALS